MLNTYEVKWKSVNRQHPDSEYTRLNRVVTNGPERAGEYIKENYPHDFLELVEVKLIPTEVQQ
jgi:hypothetical protein